MSIIIEWVNRLPVQELINLHEDLGLTFEVSNGSIKSINEGDK